MMEYRYKIGGDENDKKRLLDLVHEHWGEGGAYSKTPAAFRGQRRGLFLLVQLLLGVEAGYWENDPGAIEDFRVVILDELRKSNLSEELISGTDFVSQRP